MILLIDNYDSFVHNLARYLRRLEQDTVVVRNDAMSPRQIMERKPAAIVLSPGPCTPSESGCSLELVRAAAGQIPMLGVCLGHQTIAAAFGAKVVRAEQPMHGRSSLIRHNNDGIFSAVPNPLVVGRYHSLVVEEQSLPDEMQVTAQTGDQIVMALAHRRWPIFGVQFHPESILTSCGYSILANFLRMAEIEVHDNVPWIDEKRPLADVVDSVPAGPVTF
ncbi:MAG: aminodeoxychorismate/anthranilate synthase component II [Planctomycetia bacterium]|jgi:anthranilate synthase/aminodeoxychorismate synthase-like glutamine amidotransferase|nr:aminodeoxychorismate/anthranilate synthase component II [Planctomycetia bacterium]